MKRYSIDHIIAMHKTNSWMPGLHPDTIMCFACDYEVLEAKLALSREETRNADLRTYEALRTLAAVRNGQTVSVPRVEFDLSPASAEGKIRDKLIELGWKPPTAEGSAS